MNFGFVARALVAGTVIGVTLRPRRCGVGPRCVTVTSSTDAGEFAVFVPVPPKSTRASQAEREGGFWVVESDLVAERWRIEIRARHVRSSSWGGSLP